MDNAHQQVSDKGTRFGISVLRGESSASAKRSEARTQDMSEVTTGFKEVH